MPRHRSRPLQAHTWVYHQTTYYQIMLYWIIHWLLSALALIIVAKLLPGIQVQSFRAALIAALVIGLVSATVGLVLKIILLPFIILTLGIVYFLVNGLMLKLASELVPGFRVVGCLPAVLGSILLTIVDYILNRVAGLH
ncbi:MAG TPA: phage holin family protein [Bryobacteraceae bacterium]|nr:phage holin family protein [Bryobacteraceae bacterium]